MAEPKNRFVTLEKHKTLQKQENVVYRSGKSSISLMDFVICTDNYALEFPKGSPFFETFNGKISQMLSNGLIDHWFKNDRNPTGLNVKNEEIGPQVLSWDHLEYGFYMCLVLTAISFLVFCVEIIKTRFNDWRANKPYILHCIRTFLSPHIKNYILFFMGLCACLTLYLSMFIYLFTFFGFSMANKVF